jgi:hypothetical protein
MIKYQNYDVGPLLVYPHIYWCNTTNNTSLINPFSFLQTLNNAMLNGQTCIECRRVQLLRRLN